MFMFPPRGWEKAFADLPAGYVGNTTGGFVNTSTTTAAPNLDDLLALSRKVIAERDRIDADMVKALRDHIGKDGGNLSLWADRLRVSLLTLVEVMDGRRSPDWHFWEQVKRVFEPMREGGK